MKKYPVNEALFNMRVRRVIAHARTNSVMLKIPAIAKFECQMIVTAYYGGRFRASWALFKEAIHLKAHDIYNKAVISFCDFMGWTVKHHMPATSDTPQYWHRHGRKCSGSPNCSNVNCISESVPDWFKKLTRFDE